VFPIPNPAATFVLFSLLPLLCRCSTPQADHPSAHRDPNRILAPRKLDVPFQLGEELTYEVSYMGLSAGSAVMHVLPDERPGGMLIRVNAATSGAARLAFPLREARMVLADSGTLRPQSAHTQGRKGEERRSVLLTFDDGTRSVFGRISRNGEETVRLLHAAEAWDPASLLLLVRSIDLTPPFREDYELVLGGKLVHLVLDALEPEDVETSAGVFEQAHHLRGRVYALDDQGVPAKDPKHRFEVWIAASGHRPVVRLTKPIGWAEVQFELAGMDRVLQ